MQIRLQCGATLPWPRAAIKSRGLRLVMGYRSPTSPRCSATPNQSLLGVSISVDDEHSILLAGAKLSTLSASDFLFA